MSRRKLTKSELELWQQVAQKAERLHPHRIEAVVPAPQAMHKMPKVSTPKIEPFVLGHKAMPKSAKHSLKPAISHMLAHSPVQMDHKSFGKMKRGKLKPEGRLDLHGMRVDTAHPALNRFILGAQASGKRLVLVITGKGKDRDEPGPIPTPRGVLRNQVPQWLSLPPLAQAVLQITPAHISHGGDGAYYVYLKRNR